MLIFCHPRRLVSLADLKPKMRVLELGCGAGRVTFPMAEALPDGEVLGLDFQKGMLRLFDKRLQRSSLKNISAQHLDIRKENIPGEYDRVIIVTVLGEIPSYDDALRKVYQSLVPGGIMSITEVIPDPCYIPSKKMRTTCEALGFIHEATVHNLVSYTMKLKKPNV